MVCGLGSTKVANCYAPKIYLKNHINEKIIALHNFELDKKDCPFNSIAY